MYMSAEMLTTLLTGLGILLSFAGAFGWLILRMDSFRTELKDDIDSLRTELKDDIGSLRTELKDELGALRTEVKSDIGSLRTDLATLTGSSVRCGFQWLDWRGRSIQASSARIDRVSGAPDQGELPVEVCKKFCRSEHRFVECNRAPRRAHPPLRLPSESAGHPVPGPHDTYIPCITARASPSCLVFPGD